MIPQINILSFIVQTNIASYNTSILSARSHSWLNRSNIVSECSHPQLTHQVSFKQLVTFSKNSKIVLERSHS